MQTLLFCVIGAIVCGVWLFLQMRIFDWADKKGTMAAKVISRISLWLLSASISLVLFVAFGTLYLLFIRTLFGS